MREAGIGRVLVASLHQAIGDTLPTRLSFYESWLSARGFRDGTIGLAPFYAVLSFLRQEGDAYAMTMARAGEYAAEWTVQSMSPVQRSVLRAAPPWLRSRLLLRLGRRLLRTAYRGSRVISKVRHGTASVDVRASIFCAVREPVDYPLCGFYAAAFTKLLSMFNLSTRAEVVRCRGTGASSCVLEIPLANPRSRSQATAESGGGITRLIPALIAIAVVAGGAQPLLAQNAPPQPSSRILVMPFENVTRETRIFWLSEAAAVLVADDLNALGADAMAREERREAFERLQVPPVATLTDATVIRIGQIIGAAEVVVGTLELDGDVLVVHARSIALESGRVQNSVTERGRVTDLFDTFERIARVLAPGSRRPPESRPLDHPAVAAFEDYIKGVLADSPATAITYLNAALQAQPTFDRARLALWDVFSERGEHDRALAVVNPVPASSPWARRARFRAGLSQLNLKKYDEAFGTFKSLADQTPSASVLNNLGVIQLRRGSTPQTGRATYFFNKAVEADGTDADGFFNLGYAYWAERDPQAAIYWLREAVRRNPADGDAHFVLGAALAAAGSGAEAARERELARRLSSTYAEWEKRPRPDGVPTGLERLKKDVELPHERRVEETLAAGGQRDQEELASFYLDRARRLYRQEKDREALADLNRVLYLSPYQAEAHLLAGRIHMRDGRLHDAIDAFKISLWSAETATAHAALAGAYLEAKDVEQARAEATRALVLDPASAAAKRVLEKIPK